MLLRKLPFYHLFTFYRGKTKCSSLSYHFTIFCLPFLEVKPNVAKEVTILPFFYLYFFTIHYFTIFLPFIVVKPNAHQEVTILLFHNGKTPIFTISTVNFTIFLPFCFYLFLDLPFYLFIFRV